MKECILDVVLSYPQEGHQNNIMQMITFKAQGRSLHRLKNQGNMHLSIFFLIYHIYGQNLSVEFLQKNFYLGFLATKKYHSSILLIISP